jgi:hypothetical protein
MRPPSPALPEALFTVRHEITGTSPTNPAGCYLQADTAVIRPSTDKPHAAEVWYRVRKISDRYFRSDLRKKDARLFGSRAKWEGFVGAEKSASPVARLSDACYLPD